MKKYSIGLMLTLVLVLALSTPSFAIGVGADTSPLTKNELDATPMDRTGFIYNPYSIFVYYKGDSNDGIIRFTDTVHYFNTLNTSVTFTFGIRAYHENRAHVIPLPESIDGEKYIFYAIPKTTKWALLPDTLTVESMHKGTVKLEVEINENEAYKLAENGGLIGLVSATPSVSQNIGGTMVTSVPSYKVFIVLLPEKSNEEKTQGILDSNFPWVYVVIVIIILAIVVFIARKLEYVEVEEETVEK